jgi:phosphatidate cytidylyltransferase
MNANVPLTLAGIVVLLIIASGTVALLDRARPDHGLKDLEARVRTWWVMVAVFGAAIIAGPAVSFAVLGAMTFLALREYLALVQVRPADRPLILGAYGAIATQFVALYVGRLDLFLAVVPMFALVAAGAGVILIGDPRGFVRAEATIAWGLVVIVLGLGHLGALVALPAAGGGAGAALMLYVVVIAQVSDVAQYIVGKLAGRRRVVPRVSPNKTWEGLAGGLVAATALGGVLGPLLTPLPVHAGAALGLGIGVAGFAGDIMVSAIKRDARVKDAGTLLPGHGGVLDRVDSLILSAPLAFSVLRLAGAGG